MLGKKSKAKEAPKAEPKAPEAPKAEAKKDGSYKPANVFG